MFTSAFLIILLYFLPNIFHVVFNYNIPPFILKWLIPYTFIHRIALSSILTQFIQIIPFIRILLHNSSITQYIIVYTTAILSYIFIPNNVIQLFIHMIGGVG